MNRNAWTNVLDARAVIGDVHHGHSTRYRCHPPCQRATVACDIA